jgi:integrase
MNKLTKRIVESAALPAQGQIFIWDGELRGFGLRVAATGVRTFVLQFRNREGRSRRLALGRFGVFTVDQGRDLARIKLGEVAQGQDPADTRSAERGRIMVSELCDWYLQEAEKGRIIGRKRRPIKASTLYMDRSRIETHIKPLLGRRRVEALSAVDVEAMQADIAAGKTAKGPGLGRGRLTTGGPGAASRSVSTFHSLLAHAVRLGMIEKNPAFGVRRLAGKTRDRRLSVEEIIRLGQTMRDAEADGEHPVGIAVTRLIMITGFRLNEAAGLRHAWLNAAGGYIHFTDTKTDEQYRAIGTVAVQHILAQPQIAGCLYVFPSDAGNSQFTATDGVIGRLCKRAEIEGVTAHTLRHTFASVAGDLGFSELTIAALLGHAARSVTQRYIHVDDALKLAVERVSHRIAALLADDVSVESLNQAHLPGWQISSAE